MKMTGIKSLCSETKSLPRHGYGPGCYEVFFDRCTGQVWGNYQVDRNTWTEYENPDVIPCGWITTPATIKEISTMVHSAVRFRDSQVK